jgi:hypothetical protein
MKDLFRATLEQWETDKRYADESQRLYNEQSMMGDLRLDDYLESAAADRRAADETESEIVRMVGEAGGVIVLDGIEYTVDLGRRSLKVRDTSKAESIHEDELWGTYCSDNLREAKACIARADDELEELRRDLAIFKRLAVKFVEGDGWYAVDYESESGWHGPYLERSEAEHHAYEQLKKHGRKIAERMGRVK